MKAFIATVLATIRDRDVFLKRGTVLFRAQRGIEYISLAKTVLKKLLVMGRSG